MLKQSNINNESNIHCLVFIIGNTTLQWAKYKIQQGKYPRANVGLDLTPFLARNFTNLFDHPKNLQDVKGVKAWTLQDIFNSQ